MEGSNQENGDWSDDPEEDWGETGWAEPLTGSGPLTSSQPTPSISLSKAGIHRPAAVSSHVPEPSQLCTSATSHADANGRMNALKDLKAEVLGAMAAEEKKAGMSRMALNDNKAGMQGLDKERISHIIYEASKGSKFFENEHKKEKQVNRRISEQKEKLGGITEDQLKQGQIEADHLLEELRNGRDLSRHIVHIDMDAFYAAVEMRDNPSLRDKPMAVGGNAMLSTSNYHARRYGVRAAMPGFIAKKLCPDLVIVKTNFDKYTAVSKQVRAVMAEYDPNFCPMSLDEAYLDMTKHVQIRQNFVDRDRTFLCRTCDPFDSAICRCDPNDDARMWLLSKPNDEICCSSGDVIDVDTLINDADPDVVPGTPPSSCLSDPEGGATSSTVFCPKCKKPRPDGYKVVIFEKSIEDAVEEMRCRIEQKTLLTASAGIAPNMMLAKVCSDHNKPNGQFRIAPTLQAITDFINDLPIRKVMGIGKVSEKMLNGVGVVLCSDLYHKRALLYHLYSDISFNYFMRICLGIGSTTVERDSERKSMSTERTFSELSRPTELYTKCEELCQSLSDDLKEQQMKGKTVTIKMKTVSFEVKSRAHTLQDYTWDVDTLFGAAQSLLKVEIQAVSPQPLRLRLMGVRMSNLLHNSHCPVKKQNTITGMLKRIQGKTLQVAQMATTTTTTLPSISEPSQNRLMSSDDGLEMGFQQRDPHCETSREEVIDEHSGIAPRSGDYNNNSHSSSRSSGDNSQTSLSMSPSKLMRTGKAKASPSKLKSSSPSKVPFKVKTMENFFSSADKMTNDCDTTENKDFHHCDEAHFSSSSSMLTASTTISDLEKEDVPIISIRPEFSKAKSVLHAASNTANFCNATLVNVTDSVGNFLNDNPADHKSGDITSDLNAIMSSSHNSPVVCPICYRLINTDSLTTINNHIDDCLAKSSTSGVDNASNLIMTTPELPVLKQCLDDGYHSNRHEDETGSEEISSTSTGEEINPHQANCNHIDFEFQKDNTGTSNSDETPTSSRYTCPVCNAELKVTSLETFNEHVDQCLSKSVIRDIVREQNSQTSNSASANTSGQKRLSMDDMTQGPAAKKKRTDLPKNRSITAYMKR